MNLKPGGKAPIMHDTIYNGITQSFTFPPDYHIEEYRGKSKGMQQILIERGLWQDNLKLLKKCKDQCRQNNCCATAILMNQPDFKAQKGRIKELIISKGHKVIFYPRFHCELNFIEMFWEATKRITRARCDYRWQSLLLNVPLALDSISLLTIRKFARKSRRYLAFYRDGLDGKQAELAEKKYKSHRRIDQSYLQEMNSDLEIV